MVRPAQIPKIFDEDLLRIKELFKNRFQNPLLARDLTMIALLLRTGIKTGMLQILNRNDYNKHEGTIYPKHPKAPQKIVLDSETKELLDHYLSLREDAFEPLFVREVLKEQKKGDPSQRLTERSIQRTVKRFAENFELKGNFSPKTFRHILAKYYIALETPVASLDHIMGKLAPWVRKNYRVINENELTQKNIYRYRKEIPMFRCTKHDKELVIYIAPGRKNWWMCPVKNCYQIIKDEKTHFQRYDGKTMEKLES